MANSQPDIFNIKLITNKRFVQIYRTQTILFNGNTTFQTIIEVERTKILQRFHKTKNGVTKKLIILYSNKKINHNSNLYQHFHFIINFELIMCRYNSQPNMW